MQFLFNKNLMKKTAAQTILLAAVPCYILVLYEIYNRLSFIPALRVLSPAVPWFLTAAAGAALGGAFAIIVAKRLLKVIAKYTYRPGR